MLGLAHTLVQADARYADICAQLLEGLLWWIISTMQWHYNENINIHSRIVTLEGESLNPGGSPDRRCFQEQQQSLEAEKRDR